MKGRMNMMKKFSALALTAAMLLSAPVCMAEAVEEPTAQVVNYDIEFNGTVVSSVGKSVISAVGGNVESVSARVGQVVSAGDVLATLRTEKVYAPQTGTVAAVFAEPGDSVSEIAGRYGAVVYIEPESGRYTISGSTEKAYANSDNLYVHVGENVYLKCTDGDHTGTGFVTSVSGSSYTVEVTSGDFEVGENVNIHRSESYTSKSRIGRGSCERGGDAAIGGSSSSSSMGAAGGSGAVSIAVMHVAPGDMVQKGDLLYETLSGEYPAYYCTGADIVADADGILGELNLSVGGSVSAGGSVATIYPMGDMQIEISVNEADLPYIREGALAAIRFNWDEGEKLYTGSVFSISYVSGDQQTSQQSMQGDMGAAAVSSSSGETTYTAVISFTPDESVRLGMTATVAVAAE